MRSLYVRTKDAYSVSRLHTHTYTVVVACVVNNTILLTGARAVVFTSRSSERFDDAGRHVHVGHQQYLDGMAHEQQENRQQSGHGAVAAVPVLHGRRVLTCSNNITVFV